ncbi:glycosyltransferase family 2 protein [Pseudanabaena yagii]|uniref:Glycosyltransferase family 2 protein n=1 Tax=Pseudanabaena yagii GIHE-NHR1 TaxID=2722753 RepID=A0ABX1LQ87_9CYAN|nr:glycosyltransferase family 2 protein [Pseudanabaena yagii]NMF58279.1 glycosyltransferase family 2 protein [Pseudanabaena yagii GIHE-NHR1]
MLPQDVSNLPKVAAVIPTRNRKDKLFRFLEKFSCQTYPYLQMIIVDSNSTDGTREELVQRFPEITLICVSDREYWTGATNAGVKAALSDCYEYILTINDDSVVEQNHVERMVEIAQKHQALILGNCINYLNNPHLIWSLGTSNQWGTAKFLSLNYHDTNLEALPIEVRNSEIMQVDALAGNGVLISRQVFTQIGLYNENFLPHYHADSEIMMRAHSRGIKVFVSPAIVLLNDFHADQKRLDLKKSKGLIYALFHKKSHLFILPLIYLFVMYCPNSQKLTTLWTLIQRFLMLRSKTQVD